MVTKAIARLESKLSLLDKLIDDAQKTPALYKTKNARQDTLVRKIKCLYDHKADYQVLRSKLDYGDYVLEREKISESVNALEEEVFEKMNKFVEDAETLLETEHKRELSDYLSNSEVVLKSINLELLSEL